MALETTFPAAGPSTVPTPRPDTTPGELFVDSWASAFGQAITRLGERRPELVCISSAARQPAGLRSFARRFPQRVVDAGTAEQHAVRSAVALAMDGLRPLVCLQAASLNRAFDQMLGDAALLRLPITFVLERAGVTGADARAHRAPDLSALDAIPGLRVASPRDPARLRELLEEAVSRDGPTAVCFAATAETPDIHAQARVSSLDILRRTAPGRLDVLLVCAGAIAQPCLEAAGMLERDGVSVTVVDPRWLTPLPDSLVDLAARHQLAVTVEDGITHDGFGSQFARVCSKAGLRTAAYAYGQPIAFLPHAQRSQPATRNGVDATGIHAAVSRRLVWGGMLAPHSRKGW